MRFRIFAFMVLLSILLINITNAATIHGSIYDSSLIKIEGAVVEVNTEPKQRIVAFNGEYNFNVPKGNYKISAAYLGEDLVTLSGSEDIKVSYDGDFILDLFLLPDLSEISDINDDPTEIYEEDGTINYVLISVLSVIGFLVLFYLFFPKRFRKIEMEFKDEEEKDAKSPESTDIDDDAKKVIEVLKKEDGRMNQKDLRKLYWTLVHIDR